MTLKLLIVVMEREKLELEVIVNNYWFNIRPLICVLPFGFE